MKKIFIIFLFSLITMNSFAQNDDFVRLPVAPYDVVGARAIGMANAVSSLPDSAASVYFNPGNLTELESADMDIVYESGDKLTDKAISFIVANPKAYMDKGQSFGFRYTKRPILDDQGTVLESKLTEAFFSYGGRANIGGISAGLTMKYIEENIESEEKEWRISMDFGMRKFHHFFALPFLEGISFL